MTEEQIQANIALNITGLRKRNGMTQAELAEALNYSDKSVSKWERGDGIPDVVVLQNIAELFGVSLNDLIGEEIQVKKSCSRPSTANRIIIPLLSASLAFFVASIVFFGLKIFLPDLEKSWLIFILAIPVACIPLIVFSAIWWGLFARFVCISTFIWSLVLFVLLSFPIRGISSIIIVASIFQVLVILWFVMWYFVKKKKLLNKNNSRRFFCVI